MTPLIPGVPYEGHCFPRLLQPSDTNYDTKKSFDHIAIPFCVLYPFTLPVKNYQNFIPETIYKIYLTL